MLGLHLSQIRLPDGIFLHLLLRLGRPRPRATDADAPSDMSVSPTEERLTEQMELENSRHAPRGQRQKWQSSLGYARPLDGH